MVIALRDLMIQEIKDYGWLDYAYERGDDNAKDYQNYAHWLEHLDAEEFLAAYNRVRDRQATLD